MKKCRKSNLQLTPKRANAKPKSKESRRGLRESGAQLKKLLGNPAVDKKTKEYFVQPQTKQQIKGK
jgi:hypothetical protein